MQFGFRFQILLFSTSVRFLTKTLAYLAYKAYKAYNAFMAFKRLRLNPFQKYRSITSFSVDWPRTIRLVYASVSIFSVCTIKLQVIVNQKRRTSIAETTTPEQIRNDWQRSFISKNLVVRHVARPCPCMTTLIIIKITHVISIWTPSPIPLIGSQLVVMVLRAQWPLGTIAQFVHFVVEEKKGDKKTKAFYDWATTAHSCIILYLLYRYCNKYQDFFFY